MANHFDFDKGSLGLEIRLFHYSKMKQKSGNNYTAPRTDYKNCEQQQFLNLSVLKKTKEQLSKQFCTKAFNWTADKG